MKKRQEKITKKSQKKEILKLKKKLLLLWSDAVKEKFGQKCAYCGIKNGDPSKSNPEKFVRLNAHHLLQKEIKNCSLKYEILNGIALCPSCHKYNGEHSAHKSPIVFYDWFRINYQDSYSFILNNSNHRISLDNILALKEIESKLVEKKSLDLKILDEINREFISSTTTTTTEYPSMLEHPSILDI